MIEFINKQTKDFTNIGKRKARQKFLNLFLAIITGFIDEHAACMNAQKFHQKKKQTGIKNKFGMRERGKKRFPKKPCQREVTRHRYR
jgi:hypothetical protein